MSEGKNQRDLTLDSSKVKKKIKVEKKKFSNFISITSFVIALISLVMSIVSLLSQTRLNSIQQEELDYSKRMILSADFSQPYDHVPITSISDVFVPYDSYISYPSLGDVVRWYIPNGEFDFFAVRFEIEQVLSKSTSIKVPFSAYGDSFPVVVESKYYFNGRSVHNRALYEIKFHYDFVPKDDAEAENEVRLVAMNLVRNLEKQEDIKEIISQGYQGFISSIDRLLF